MEMQALDWLFIGLFFLLSVFWFWGLLHNFITRARSVRQKVIWTVVMLIFGPVGAAYYFIETKTGNS